VIIRLPHAPSEARISYTLGYAPGMIVIGARPPHWDGKARAVYGSAVRFGIH
jgi:hypothetical protein